MYQTVSSLKEGGCRFGSRPLRVSAPVFRAVGLDSSATLTLVNPSEDGDCGAQMMKMLMLATGSACLDPRERIMERVTQRGMFEVTMLPLYRRSLLPEFGFRFLELWEILLLCEDLHLNPIVLAMSQQRGKNSSHQYMKYSFTFEAEGASEWPLVVIAMTNESSHYELLARKEPACGSGTSASLSFTFAPDELPTRGDAFIHGGGLRFDDWIASESSKNQTMDMAVEFAPPRGCLLDDSEEPVVMDPTTLRTLPDYNEDRFVVELSDRTKKDFTNRLRYEGRIQPKSATSSSGAAAGKRQRMESACVAQPPDDTELAIALSLSIAGCSSGAV